MGGLSATYPGIECKNNDIRGFSAKIPNHLEGIKFCPSMYSGCKPCMPNLNELLIHEKPSKF